MTLKTLALSVPYDDQALVIYKTLHIIHYCTSSRDGEIYAMHLKTDIDGLVQERRKSIANTLELNISYTNSSIDTLAW